MDYPNGIAIAANRDIYVCNAANDSVQQFSGLSGSLVRTYQSALLRTPSGIVLREPGDMLVTNWLDDNVIKIDLQTAQGTVFAAPASGGLDGPGSLMISPNTNVLVAGQVSNAIHEYDSNGNFVRIAAQGNGLAGPGGLLLDQLGNLVVASFTSGQILKFSNSGAFLSVFVSAGSGGLTNPEGIAWSQNGNLLVCNRNGANVLEFDGGTGSFVRVFATDGMNQPNYIAPSALILDCNGNGVPDSCDPALTVGIFVNVLLGVETNPVYQCLADENRDGLADGRDVHLYTQRFIGN